MKIEDLHRTVIQITVPEGHKAWMPFPQDAITIDGQVLGPNVNIGIHHQLRDRAPHVTIDDTRVLYPTEVYVNGIIAAIDNGLLWDKRPLVLKGVAGAQ